MVRPSPTIKRNGKQVPNGRHLAIKPVVAHGITFYGDPERLRFAVAYQERDRKAKVPRPDINGRTRAALVEAFGISDRTAEQDLAGLRAYRMAQFHAELPTYAAKSYETLQRLLHKAEADGDWQAAIQAEDKCNKLTGAYAAIKVDVDVAVHDGPTVQQQLRAMLGVLDAQDQRDLERILAKLEVAKAEGRYQLESGDGEPGNDDATDAEVLAETIESHELTTG